MVLHCALSIGKKATARSARMQTHGKGVDRVLVFELIGIRQMHMEVYGPLRLRFENAAGMQICTPLGQHANLHLETRSHLVFQKNQEMSTKRAGTSAPCL
ncbi:MAG: hypothetical protein ACI8W7_004013 [Gammaproteobacteria bacterium]|jgi:hypothetical protein